MTLRELQIKELNILKQTISIIEAHNLSYFAIGGTLLGAIRHKGFIPWDDDIDICMSRPDYEKFLEYAQKELPEGLELGYFKTNPNHQKYCARIIDKNTTVKRNDAINDYYVNIWIDILPLDGMPDNKFMNKLHRFHLLRRRLFLQYSIFDSVKMNKKRKLFETILVKIGFIFTKIIHLDSHKQMFKLDKVLTKYPYEFSENVINFMGADAFKEIFKRSAFEEKASYNFEDIEIIGPKDYDYILKTIYGDYMTLPKEEDRVSHSFVLEDNINK
ncbi:MAG: LicD family protein [Treponema sp.]|nr:LicD family protein [Treponema sp.]